MVYSRHTTPRWRSIKDLIKRLRKLIALLIDMLRLVDALNA
ncbi:hypothetical protein [Agromyces neolithicus]|uniref:Uncharacterized protein n=1 Tax=Agromyces neolithicus TaxID=269420 RepID=A0ABP4YNA8_9MICO